MRTLTRLLLLLAAGGLVFGCGGSPPDSDAEFGTQPFDPDPMDNPDDDPMPPVQGTTTDDPIVPLGSTPPIGVTFHVGVTENVSLAAMQQLYATFIAANNVVWNASEGQVRIHRVRFWDNVGPGVTAFNFAFGGAFINTANLDVIAFPPQQWNFPASAAVAEMGGRKNRTMIAPTNINTFVLTHELGHFLFQLSWSPGPLLVDEYQDGVQDPACIMESENLPLRWCADANHASQSSQPHSCWRQILLDYPTFSHTGADTAPNLPPVPIAEYNDTP